MPENHQTDALYVKGVGVAEKVDLPHPLRPHLPQQLLVRQVPLNYGQPVPPIVQGLNHRRELSSFVADHLLLRVALKP